ncbi:unnamed protein product [Ceutorhynchus assimilis]|uniref:RanBP2-type domain-containing protein n=1 Tax=Ceutorhynchus assimilis TaxID=467358 RepID=A0A9N9N2Z5_9CUCU|nr:unnamed protein product [Ceutorhynchus assimilis]
MKRMFDDLKQPITFNGDMVEEMKGTMQALLDGNKMIKKEQAHLRLRIVELESEITRIESSTKDELSERSKNEKDSYGNEVSRLARPLPVEYLLVDVPASTPVTPTYSFNPDSTKQPFPDFNALANYLQQFSFDQSDEFYEAISDFHLLIYIATMDMLPMRDDLGPLLEALKNKDREAAVQWSRSEQWATLEQLIVASSPPTSRPGSVAGGTVGSSTTPRGGPIWTCSFCTFINDAEVQNCAMCNLPRART